MTNPHKKNEAHELLTQFIVAGIVIALIGGVIAGWTFPGTESNLDPDTLEITTEQTGNLLGVLVGMVAAAVGSALFTVGLIGHAVRLGRLASPERQEVAS
jgi:uncharacterized membrane protein YeaQ/YmgE (transglycosylase-associated protein family)